MKTDSLKEAGKVMKVQQYQIMSAEEQLYQIKEEINYLSDSNDFISMEIDQLIMQAESLCEKQGISTENVTEKESEEGLICAGFHEDECVKLSKNFIKTDIVDFNNNWEQYLNSIYNYADSHHIDFVADPYTNLLSQSQYKDFQAQIKNDYYGKKPQMDRYDYIISAMCGVFSGLIDSFFVGKPGASSLGDWTNSRTDGIVMKAAKLAGWNPDAGYNNIDGAIRFLERKYPVNYDQGTGNAAQGLLGMSLKNHHIKSLGHSPDIVGMVFSILDQFCNTSHFLDNGRLIVMDTASSQLIGKSGVVSKIFAGFVNWIGHCLSDIAGSSGNRKINPDLYGSGISIPFFELFQGVGVGSFTEDHLTIADTAVKMFENGYEARFGMAMSIPVVINELLVRFCFMVKRHYYNKEPWKKCIPIVLIKELKDSDSNAVILRRMILASYGSMCLVDFTDATIRSGGNIVSLNFLLHLNFVAWSKFAIDLAITGVMEVRLNYNSKHLNVKKLDRDLQKEWERLCSEAAK